MIAQAADGHVMIATDWGGLTRHVFISFSRVELDAGRELTRGEAVDYVLHSSERYRQEAMLKNAMTTSLGAGVTVLLDAVPLRVQPSVRAGDDLTGQDVIDLESVRQAVAQRACDLTGVPMPQIVEDLSSITFGPGGPDASSWVLTYKGKSSLVRSAVEHAIFEIKD